MQKQGYMSISLIEKHYLENYSRLVKKMTFRAGTVWSAEDVVQTAYERAIRYRRNCDPERFGQWFSMLLNNSLRDFKAEERGHTASDIDDEDVAATTSCPHYPEKIMKEIYELIDTKSENQMEVLKLYFEQGMTSKDIANITQHSDANCRQIIKRFRDELKDIYSDA